MAEDSWPPKSPLKALLSSPSGRRRYQEYKDGASRSPDKLFGTPSLLDKLRAARADRDDLIIDNPQADQSDEDEETLKLQLAAIEAKLKLKKLQQAKRDRQDNDARAETASYLQVRLSPAKRTEQQSTHRSPARVLLGIDKGLTAADVSLKRARSVGASPSKSRLDRPRSVVSSRLHINARDAPQSSPAPVTVKSFSERMAAMRETENANEEKHKARDKARSSTFKVDRNELNSYRDDSGSTRNRQQADRDLLNSHRTQLASNRKLDDTALQQPSNPPSPTKQSSASTMDADQNSTAPKSDSSLYEGFSRTHLSTRILPHSFLKRTLPSTDYTLFRIPDLLKVVHSPAYEIPESSLKAPNFVVFGVIASKSAPLNHQPKAAKTPTDETSTDTPEPSTKTKLSVADRSKSKQDWERNWEDGSHNSKKFLALTLTDLKWTLDLYLFATAVPRYHRLSPGTVIAILNPSIMPPKPGREDTGCFSLALHSGDDSADGTQILEIGTARHLGFCSATKFDGHACGHWINKSKTEICEYHLNARIARTQSSRMGVNASTAGAFGGDRTRTNSKRQMNVLDSRSKASEFDHDYGRASGRGVSQKPGRHFDFGTGSQYYIAPGVSSAANRNGTVVVPGGRSSAAAMLDEDDPFLAEGLRSGERDREARFRKRAEAMQKEREIVKKLGKVGGSAGGEYMRFRSGGPAVSGSLDGEKRKANIKEMKESILNAGPASGKRKAAESIRLSPMKKTRFLTDRGIKEAGRDSLGGTRLSLDKSSGVGDDYDDDDDDLDIV